MVSCRGPCDWSRPVSSRGPTSTGWSRWSSSRSPSAGGAPGTASAIRGGMRSSGSGPRCRARPGRRRSRRSRPGSGGCGPSTSEGRGGAGASTARPTRATGSSTFPWVGAERALHAGRGGRGARRSATCPPGAASASRRAQERLLARWDEPHRRRPGHAPGLDPRRGPHDPDRLDLGHQRQEHGDPADHPHPGAGRAARRDDDLGRGARGRADGRAGRLDRPRRRAADPAADATSTSPSSRRRAAGSCCAASATNRTTRASSPTSRPTTSTCRASTRCPSWPRSSPRSAGSPGPTAGSSSTPTTPWLRPSPGASVAGVAYFTLGGRGARTVRRHRAAGGRAYLVRDGLLVEANGDARDRDRRGRPGSRSRSAGWPGTTSPTRWPRPVARAGWAPRSSRSATGWSTSRPTRSAPRGGSTCSAWAPGWSSSTSPTTRPGWRRSSTSPRGSPPVLPGGPRRSP